MRYAIVESGGKQYKAVEGQGRAVRAASGTVARQQAQLQSTVAKTMSSGDGSQSFSELLVTGSSKGPILKVMASRL